MLKDSEQQGCAMHQCFEILVVNRRAPGHFYRELLSTEIFAVSAARVHLQGVRHDEAELLVKGGISAPAPDLGFCRCQFLQQTRSCAPHESDPDRRVRLRKIIFQIRPD